MCESLDVEYLGVSAFIRISFTPYTRVKGEPRRKHHQIIIFAHHRGAGGRKPGNKLNRLLDQTAYFNANIYLNAHNHTLAHTDHIMLDIGNRGKTITEVKKTLCCTGSFLRTYTRGAPNYAEKMALPPQKIGVVRIDCYPKKYGVDIHVSE